MSNQRQVSLVAEEQLDSDYIDDDLDMDDFLSNFELGSPELVTKLRDFQTKLRNGDNCPTTETVEKLTAVAFTQKMSLLENWAYELSIREASEMNRNVEDRVSEALATLENLNKSRYIEASNS
eukprot:TRINITY_DN6365_c0_g1_i2.p1 TRINITY_DN6365_c0_g1~~TRINITY_DN6365_c0_g1_i2.p1  ORF type:complete len:123 (+),score=14.23 TRINITY_DN6365_c0_g1_i2:32-400(+)